MAARLPVAGRARRRQERGAAAIAWSTRGNYARRSGARRAAADAGRLGESQSRCERQVEFLQATEFTGEFYLTQIVSHHELEPVAQFMETARGEAESPGPVWRVLLPQRESGDTRDAQPVPACACARSGKGVRLRRHAGRGRRGTIRAMMNVGVRHFYVSNLPLGRAESTLTAILEAVRG